jgi:hypothetical protein
MLVFKRIGWAAAAALLSSGATLAQQGPPAPPQQVVTWQNMPRMQLEQQYAGPLQDTTIQRWRDPQSGVLCYVYLPFTAAHSAPTGNGFVQYGPNAIGSISCVESGKVTAAAPKTSPPTRPPAKPPS